MYSFVHFCLFTSYLKCENLYAYNIKLPNVKQKSKKMFSLVVFYGETYHLLWSDFSWSFVKACSVEVLLRQRSSLIGLIHDREITRVALQSKPQEAKYYEANSK